MSYPHSRLLARSAPARSARNFAQQMSSVIIALSVKTAKPQSTPAINAFAIPHRVDRALDALGHHLRMLQMLGHVVDHARDQDHRVGQGVLAQRLVLVLVAGVGEGDVERAHARPS